MQPMTALGDDDYVRLLEFRTALRRFLHWSERQAQAAGLTPTQHQLLLVIRGHSLDAAPTIGEIAHTLYLRHHSAVELVDRAQAAGLVRRVHDATDQRQVRVRLTSRGARCLEKLSLAHLEELSRSGSSLRALTRGLDV
jgi:DNA-binding MarR family transcriptional regulator